MTIKNRYFWIAAFVALVLDQLTKYWVLQSLELCDLSAPREFCDDVPVWDGVFHFIYVTNPGAAWSIGANLPYFPIFLRVLSMLVSLVLVLVGVFVSGMNRWEQVGYGCVLGGAFGNGLDRLAAGEVVDFLDFRLINFPVFNIADVAINVGIICLLIGFYVSSNGNGRRKNGDHYRS